MASSADNAFRLPITAALAHDCVRPGAAQSITIHTERDARVAFGSTYADGKSAMSEGFYGGNSGGVVDANGDYRGTWVVGATAPSGPVKVEVAGVHAKDGIGRVDVWFAVADASGTCA